MSEDAPPKFSCDVCGRTQTVRQGPRGPVKGDLEIRQIGNFRFCEECFFQSEAHDRISNGVALLGRRMLVGPSQGQIWIYQAEIVG